MAEMKESETHPPRLKLLKCLPFYRGGIRLENLNFEKPRKKRVILAVLGYNVFMSFFQ